mmetsp:Transcript_74943/g.156249  ORF Transcript_74943/g.156249 Transcript_74943/m.156249 type:complete len:252 (-) Transcript_74943:1025-1780(-)
MHCLQMSPRPSCRPPPLWESNSSSDRPTPVLRPACPPVAKQSEAAPGSLDLCNFPRVQADRGQGTEEEQPAAHAPPSVRCRSAGVRAPGRRCKVTAISPAEQPPYLPSGVPRSEAVEPPRQRLERRCRSSVRGAVGRTPVERSSSPSRSRKLRVRVVVVVLPCNPARHGPKSSTSSEAFQGPKQGQRDPPCLQCFVRKTSMLAKCRWLMLPPALDSSTRQKSQCVHTKGACAARWCRRKIFLLATSAPGVN